MKNSSVTYNLLLQCKHVVIEKLVQLLICVVDAELLKRIDVKIFEAENVQNAKKSR